MIHAVAIDDEPVALSIIRQFCLRDGDVALDSYSDPVEGLEAVRRIRPQLVFLDIEMNGISGLDVARTLPEGTFLIFTTAYARFALDGFELNAVDYGEVGVQEYQCQVFRYMLYRGYGQLCQNTCFRRKYRIDADESEGFGGHAPEGTFCQNTQVLYHIFGQGVELYREERDIVRTCHTACRPCLCVGIHETDEIADESRMLNSHPQYCWL